MSVTVNTGTPIYVSAIATHLHIGLGKIPLGALLSCQTQIEADDQGDAELSIPALDKVQIAVPSILEVPAPTVELTTMEPIRVGIKMKFLAVCLLAAGHLTNASKDMAAKKIHEALNEFTNRLHALALLETLEDIPPGSPLLPLPGMAMPEPPNIATMGGVKAQDMSILGPNLLLPENAPENATVYEFDDGVMLGYKSLIPTDVMAWVLKELEEPNPNYHVISLQLSEEVTGITPAHGKIFINDILADKFGKPPGFHEESLKVSPVAAALAVNDLHNSNADLPLKELHLKYQEYCGKKLTTPELKKILSNGVPSSIEAFLAPEPVISQETADAILNIVEQAAKPIMSLDLDKFGTGGSTSIKLPEVSKISQWQSLKACVAVGHPCGGTSAGSKYHCVAISEKVNVAARIGPQGETSVRAETKTAPWDQNALVLLADAGWVVNPTGHASLHLKCATPARAFQAVGALLMSLGCYKYTQIMTDLQEIVGKGE